MVLQVGDQDWHFGVSVSELVYHLVQLKHDMSVHQALFAQVLELKFDLKNGADSLVLGNQPQLLPSLLVGHGIVAYLEHI